MECVMLLLCGCSSQEPDAPPLTKRTVLVYMVANNASLGGAGYDALDIEEMKAAAANGDLAGGRLIVYHAGVNAEPQLLDITQAGIVVLKTYDDSQYSVERARLEDVISDTKRYAPAEDYGLVLWSHASGWLQDGITEADEASTLSFGYDRGKKMNVSTLAKALTDKGFSFVYFDCCQMASVEVVYELRHATDFIVASAIELPIEGMPYDKNVKCFFTDTPDLIQAARNTFELYDGQENPENRWCSMSVIDTSEMDALADATRAIYSALPDMTLPPGYTPQKYQLDGRVYLYDFADYVTSMAEAYGIPALLISEYDEAMHRAVIYKDATPMLYNTLPLTRHSGLSTFIMKSQQEAVTKNYNQLQWFADVASALIKTSQQ